MLLTRVLSTRIRKSHSAILILPEQPAHFSMLQARSNTAFFPRVWLTIKPTGVIDGGIICPVVHSFLIDICKSNPYSSHIPYVPGVDQQRCQENIFSAIKLISYINGFDLHVF